jgi:chorismate dehydratase
LVWSFIYCQNHGRVEIILDNAPARSAELLSQARVDAGLVPVIAYQSIDDIFLVPDVCVGARDRVRSVCLATKGYDLDDVRTVALDASSRTSVSLTKILFREFIGHEPEWRTDDPNADEMLAGSDCALIIGDPALGLAKSNYRVFDLAALWNRYTGLGFVFAMWMSRQENSPIDFASARDEGLSHVDEMINNYASEIDLPRDEMRQYLTQNICYTVDEKMRQGMELYFKLAHKHNLIVENKPLRFTNS